MYKVAEGPSAVAYVQCSNGEGLPERAMTSGSGAVRWITRELEQ